MDFEDLTRWQRVSLARHFRSFEKQLLARNDKGILLSIRIARVQEFLINTQTDPYLSGLINIYVENEGTGITLDSVLSRIEKLRLEQEKILLHGEKFSWTVTAGDFVKEKRTQKILGFIVRWYACGFALGIYISLFNAVKKNVPDRKLKEIFQRAYKMNAPIKGKLENNSPATGFEWQQQEKAKTFNAILYNGLIKGRFINAQTKAETFNALFNGKVIKEKIHWIASLPHLVYFFNGLVRFELSIPQSVDFFIENNELRKGEKQLLSEWLYGKLCGAFINPKGDDLTSAKLTDAANQLVKNSKEAGIGKPLLSRSEDIDAILKSLQ